MLIVRVSFGVSLLMKEKLFPLESNKPDSFSDQWLIKSQFMVFPIVSFCFFLFYLIKIYAHLMYNTARSSIRPPSGNSILNKLERELFHNLVMYA